MKIYLIIFYLTAFLFTLSTTAKAQDKDYVINNLNDTILCKIKTSALGGNPKYKPLNATQGDYIKITTEDIKEYYLSDPHIVFRRIYSKDSTGKDLPVEFMRPLEKGTISIYLQETTTTVRMYGQNKTSGYTCVQWYVTKNSDTATLVRVSGRGIFEASVDKKENVFAEFLRDKKDVYDKFIKDNKFDTRHILNIVHLYNTGDELGKDH